MDFRYSRIWLTDMFLNSVAALHAFGSSQVKSRERGWFVRDIIYVVV